jgi:UDP-N-acetylmuramoyl-L-alanyl-D-glutamate--2,6-diaminopimelate ligase
MRLNDLLQSIPEVEVQAMADVQISGISFDSRTAGPDSLFVAIRGGVTDGNRFVGDAVARGVRAVASDVAVAVPPGVAMLRVGDARRFLAMAARTFFGDPASRLELVAVTGTNGKTTTTCLLDRIFVAAGLRSCVVGTLGTSIGERFEPGQHTTPEAPDLLRILAEALRQGCSHGAVEVSSHALALRRVFGVHFKVGVFTNLTPEHLDFHGDMESYYKAKRLLFSDEGDNSLAAAAVNIDDRFGRRLATETSVPVVTFGMSEEAEVRPLEQSCDRSGIAIRAVTPAGVITLRSPLVGSVNVYNILGAVAASTSLGIDTGAIASGVAALMGVPGRMERVDAGQAFPVYVDYAHTPDALERLLRTVRELGGGRIVTVFGCGGNRDRAKRPLMGRIAAALSDLVIATSDNPRDEDPAEILREIETGLAAGPAPYRIVVDRRDAIRMAIQEVGVEDSVIIAGKGHEDYQIIAGMRLPFDDRGVARELIADLKPRWHPKS